MLLSVIKVISFHLQQFSIIKFPFFTSVYIVLKLATFAVAVQCPVILYYNLTHLPPSPSLPVSAQK